MNPPSRYLLAMVFLASAIGFASAQFQPAEVKKSNERVLIQGRYYYIHTVQKGQTLYSICRVYGVNQEMVLQENPGIDPVALKEGQALRIPDWVQTAPDISGRDSEDKKKEDKRFYYHTVKVGQTVYFLSRKYDVPEEWIYQFNPHARESISAGQVILIPKRKEFEPLLADEDTSKYWYYVVKEKDTLYTLSRLYGVSVAQIINENPELQQSLKAGITIRIPKHGPADSLDMLPDSSMLTDQASPVCDILYSDKREYKVALLLPFHASLQMDEPTEVGQEEKSEAADAFDALKHQQEVIGRSFVEFYEGFLLALDTLKQSGMSVKLYVYDTEKDTLKVKKIIQDLYMIQPDLIIGPVYAEEVRLVSQFARVQDILMVSPLSTRNELIDENQHIIQVVPSDEEEYAFFARYISRYKDHPIILFRGADSSSLKETWKLKREMLPYLEQDSLGNPINFRDYKLNDSTLRKLSKILLPEKENIVLIASRNEPDVTLLISKLYLHARVYKMMVFGDPAWQVWKSIDLNYFHTMQLQYYTPFYIDYENPDVIRFIRKCRRIYNFEPYEVTPKGYNFCMLGHDIGLYFLSALDRYGRKFAPCMNNLEMNLLLTRFYFDRAGTGGYSNKTVNMIRYNSDYTLEKIEVEQSVDRNSVHQIVN